MIRLVVQVLSICVLFAAITTANPLAQDNENVDVLSVDHESERVKRQNDYGGTDMPGNGKRGGCGGSSGSDASTFSKPDRLSDGRAGNKRNGGPSGQTNLGRQPNRPRINNRGDKKNRRTSTTSSDDTTESSN